MPTLCSSIIRTHFSQANGAAPEQDAHQSVLTDFRELVSNGLPLDASFPTTFDVGKEGSSHQLGSYYAREYFYVPQY